MAPLAARDPYKAVAPAPLSTVTDSMSSGLISDIPFPKSTGESDDKYPLPSPDEDIPELIGIPSTTINAPFALVFTDLFPRKTTCVEFIGPELDDVNVIPGTLPFMLSTQLLERASVKVSPDNFCCE